MKSFSAASLIVASLVTYAAGQRLHIVEPTPLQTVQKGQNLTVELQQDLALTPLVQVSVLIAAVNCFNTCDQPDTWGPSTILYNGPFDPEEDPSQPQKNHFQDFSVSLDSVVPGEVVISVAHEMIAVNIHNTTVFDYSTVHINVVDGQ